MLVEDIGHQIEGLNEMAGHQAFRTTWRQGTLVITRHSPRGNQHSKDEFHLPQEFPKLQHWLKSRHNTLANKKARASQPSTGPRSCQISIKVSPAVHEWIEALMQEDQETRGGVVASLLEELYWQAHPELRPQQPAPVPRHPQA